LNQFSRQRGLGFMLLGVLGLALWLFWFGAPAPVREVGELSLPDEPPPMTRLEFPKESPPLLSAAEGPQAMPRLLGREQATEGGAGQLEPGAEAIPERPPLLMDRAVRVDFDTDGIPVTWAIQVASLSSAPGARELAQRLAGRGYDSFVRPVKIGGRFWHRVYVGPEIDHAQALRIKRALDGWLEVDSRLVQVRPDTRPTER